MTKMTVKEQVEELAAELANAEIAVARANKGKKDVRARALELLENENNGLPESGTIHLEGDTRKLSFSFRQNISYPDKAGLEEVYCALSEEQQDEMFRISLSEKTRGVQKFLESNSEPADRLRQLRTIKPGAATIKVGLIT